MYALVTLLLGIKGCCQVPDLGLIVSSSRYKTRFIGMHIYGRDTGACRRQKENPPSLGHGTHALLQLAGKIIFSWYYMRKKSMDSKETQKPREGPGR